MGVNGSVKSFNIMSQNKHFQVCTLDIYRFFSVAKAGWINSLETFSILNFWSTFRFCISKKTKNSTIGASSVFSVHLHSLRHRVTSVFSCVISSDSVLSRFR